MPWKSLGLISLNSRWSVTRKVNGEIFRIKHLSIINPDSKYLKSTISPAFFDENREVNLFRPQLLTYRQEFELFWFNFPTGISELSIGFKRLDSTPVTWTIKAEYWEADTASQDFLSYLQSRFSDMVFSYLPPQYIQEKEKTVEYTRPILEVWDTTPQQVVPQREPGKRASYLVTNAGDDYCYFKFSPEGQDGFNVSIDIASEDYSFVLPPGASRIVENSVNALGALCKPNDSTKVIRTETFHLPYSEEASGDFNFNLVSPNPASLTDLYTYSISASPNANVTITSIKDGSELKTVNISTDESGNYSLQLAVNSVDEKNLIQGAGNYTFNAVLGTVVKSTTLLVV